MTTPPTNKLDIFELLRRIDAGETEFYATLSDEQKKGFAAIVVTRWLSGTTDPTQLVNVNIVNALVFNLHNHPDLLFRLMVATNSGKKQQYNWVKPKKKERLTKSVDVISRYAECSNREARDYVKLYSAEQILDMADELGETKEFVKLLKAELK